MNYFFIFWYGLLSSFSFMIFKIVLELDSFKLSNLFETNHFFEKVWILPFYIVSEIIYFTINKIGELQDEKILLSYTDDVKKKSLENTCCVIPCHHVEDDIKKNLVKIRKKFEYVFVADNDANTEKNHELEAFCEDHGIIYFHYSIPNKTNAIFQTVKNIKNNYINIQKVVLLDDDTIVRDDFFIREDFLAEPTTAGYTCTIGIDKSKTNFFMLEHLVDFEYRTISYRNRSRNIHTLKFLHGIICVYKIDSLLNIFQWNVCQPGGLPFGEDAFGGLVARNIGYKLQQDHLNIVYTYCPQKFFNWSNNRQQGYGAASLFKQRVLRWYLSWPRRVLNEFALLFFYDTGNCIGNILYRFDFIWYIWILSVSSWWIGILIEMTLSFNNFKNFSYLHLVFYVLNIVTSFLRRLSMSPTERENISWFVPFVFPFFLLILMFFYSISFLISLFYYIPFKRVDYKKCYENVR
tara:strand:- start:72 stop:1463 length:1392 start_codon:yes stop_codon:yes gene_type:complete